MKRIQLWAVRESPSGPIAEAVVAHENVAMEAHLEEILVRSPALLGQGMTIVARQAPTEGGPLDLLGIDEAGRLVLFELKRGVLTRDAVAQALDYISDLAVSGAERVARLIEQSSGRLGVERIDDFDEWYSERFPDSEGPLASSPKMILVGLGVDPRALRIVDYLASQGVAIELLTFHAFDSEGTTFLARQVESAPSGRTGNFLRYKTRNLESLHEAASAAGCSELFEEMIEFVGSIVIGPQHPARRVYTFNHVYAAADGKRRRLACVSLQPSGSPAGGLRLVVLEPAAKAAPDAVEAFRSKYADIASRSRRGARLEVALQRKDWDIVSGDVGRMLRSITSALSDGIGGSESEAD